MTVMRSKAFAPGHVSGFFQICKNPKNPEKYGSRGAGLCLTKGATSAVEIRESGVQRIRVFINGKESAAEVTRQAIKNLLRSGVLPDKKIGQKSTKTKVSGKKYDITVNTTLDLPVSQGFGMSAAGALSAALATASALGLKYPKNEAVCSAHKAEITCGTGLGDVVAEACGGVVIRREPGIPPYGVLESIENQSDVVLCVVGGEIPTKSIIRSQKHVGRINKSGGRCIEELVGNPTIENLFGLAYRFTLETKLVARQVLHVIGDVRRYGMASACMLGNSVFAVGDVDKITDILRGHGETYLCEIDGTGMRVLP